MKNNVIKRILSILTVVLMTVSIFPVSVLKAEATVQTESTRFPPYTVTLLKVSSEKFTQANERLEMFQVRAFDTEKGEIYAVVKFRGTSGFQNYWPSDVISGTFPIRNCAQPYEEEIVLTYTQTNTSDPYFTSFLPFDVDFTIKVTRPATEHTGNATCTKENACTVCSEIYKAPCNYQWKQENGQHWQECTADSTHAKVNAGSCSGGRATCTDQATCETCNFKYGKALGHDWSNLDGICANGCGTECFHDGQTGATCTICGKTLHTHDYVYTASGNVITAICSNTDGNCPDTNGGTLTISAPADLYIDGETAKEVVIDNQLVETVDYTVTYSTADGSAPEKIGTYTAMLTLGNKSVTVSFTLKAKVSVGGTVTSFGSDTDDITIELFADGTEDAVYSVTEKGNSTEYSLDNVENGTYRMVVSKNNHVTREYEIVIGQEDITQNVKIHLKGDINGDGKLNSIDVARANSHARGVAVLTGYELMCADANGNGSANSIDVARMNAHVRSIAALW
ncbi:MAG: hypothetical protein E7555_07875 [Ruminococcaceae bacterium]|nr:hypothetical protein [Oscillospiraceae bacterium]